MKTSFVALLLSASTLSAQAQTTVREPWIRATVVQQRATGLFAQISSAQGGKLVSASSPAAGVVEIHEMALDGDVMKMRALPAGVDLPAGKAVELKPGGMHIMLMDLKKPLSAGDMVAVTLVVEGRDRQRETLQLQVPVKAPGDAKAGHKH